MIQPKQTNILSSMLQGIICTGLVVVLVYTVQYGVDNFDLDYSVFLCHRLIIFRGFLNVKLDGVKFYVIFFPSILHVLFSMSKRYQRKCFGLMCALPQLLTLCLFCWKTIYIDSFPHFLVFGRKKKKRKKKSTEN